MRGLCTQNCALLRPVGALDILHAPMDVWRLQSGRGVDAARNGRGDRTFFALQVWSDIADICVLPCEHRQDVSDHRMGKPAEVCFSCRNISKLFGGHVPSLHVGSIRILS